METQCQWGQPFPVQSIALEPRLMFDAGLAALAMETMAGERVVSTQHIDWIHQGQDPDHQQEIQALLHHWEKPTNAPQTVVFIDSRVPDLNSLLTAIPQGTHVEIIKPGEDGIARITHELQGMKNLESIQIISHGSSGHVLLGNANVDIGSIKAKEASLAQWGKALIPGGDLLLYGCDIAKGLEGQAFIRELAHETGAAVAASTDDTGAKPLGGNWDLEYKVGVVQDHWGLNPLAKDEYTGLLANLLVTSTNDSGAGTLRNTVAAAAAGDTIQFDPNLRNGAGQIAISLTSGAIALPNVTVDGDIAYTGHALDGKADVTIDGSTNNSSIFTIASGATLKSLTLTHGAGTIIGASRLGGDVYITGGTVTITDTSITAGTATFGGGLRVDSATVTLTRCTVSGNAVTAAGTASGGGIYASNSTLTLTDSTVSNNTAKTNGGGIYVSSATANATLTILNSTVTANVAKYSLAGVGNEGGGVLTFAGIGTMTFYIGNSLVKENYLGSIGGTANDINRAGLSYSYGYNMIGKLNLISGASFAVASDLEGTSYNAGLLPLADNGGTTQTHALTSSSQAINKGDPNYSGSLTTDQAGHQRVVGSSIDIGAYELQYIEGLTAGQTVNDNSQLSPFSSVTIPNDGTVTVTITLDDAAKGSFTAASLTASGFTGPVGNAYSLASTTAALAQTAIRALVFTPTSNRVAPGSTETTTLTTVITDGSLTFNDATTTIISTSINDAPTATQTNQSVTFLEDAASVALTPIVVGDVDVSAVITATLTLANPAAGSLTTTGGGSYVSGTGVWSITGTVSQVNTALAALTFIPTANWETNTTLAVNVTDGTLATTGTTSLNVTPVNDAPTATNTTQNITFTENAASVTWTPVVVSDVDTGEVITAQLTLADPAAGVLTTTGGGSYVAGTGVWSVTGSVSTVNTALASVTLVPSSHWTSATSIAINIADGGEDGQLPATGTIAFTVTPLSSSGPTATNTTQTVTYVEDAAQVTWTPIVVTDTDAGATITATVTLADPAAGSLTITGGGSYVAGTGVWSVTGSVSQVNTALAAITFIPTTNWDSNTTLALNVTDGTVAVTGSIALNVTPVNDAPTATNTSQNITFTENSASVTWTPVVVSDVDTGEVITAQLTLADPAAGVLTTTGGGSYVSGTGVWSVTGSVSTVNTALASVTLVPSSHWTSTTSIAINIADGGENGQLPVTGSISFTVTPLPSSGPTATNTTQTVSYVEDASQVTWTPIVVTDTDAGATITATLTLADPAAGSLTTTGGGSYGVNTGIWSATGSVSQVNTALAALTFIPTTDWDTNTTLALNVTDGTVAVTGSIALNVTPVNDAPTATNTTQNITFTENSASVTWTPVVVSDVDTGEVITAQLTLADPAAGVLTTTGGGSYVSGTGVWSVTGSVAQVNTALAAVTLVPSTHWTSTTSIAINIADGGENGQLPVTGSISFTVTPLPSSGPTATNTTQTVTYVEDATQVTWTPIVVSDTDAGATITATLTLADPAAGSLTTTGGGSYGVNTGIWSATGSVSQVNTALAAIRFIPTTDWDVNTTLAVNVTDGTVAATGTIALDVTPVNDGPTATHTTQSVTFVENAASVSWTPVVVSDVDTGDFVTAQLTLADPTAGVLTTTGGGSYVSETGVWSVTGSVSQVNTALASVTLVPGTHWTSTTSIAINIADGGENGQLPVTGSISLQATPKDTLTPPTPNQPVDTTPPQKPTDATTPQKPTDATTPQKPTDATTPQTPAPGDTVANQTTPSTSSTSNAVTTIPLATDSVPAPTATRPIVIPQGGDHVTNKDINPITELAHLQTSANDANHQISSPWAPAINGVGSGGGRGMFNTQGGTTETGSGLGSHWDVKDISPSLETLLHVTDNVTKGVMDMGVLVSTMNQAGLSITEQKILLQHLGSSAILDGYNAAGNLDYRQGADVLERLARGETVTQGEWLQVMDKNNLDPKERLSHMLAFQVVQKAQRTEMFAQALVQLDTQEQSNPFERVKPMEEDVTYFKGKFPELTSSKVAILIGINTYPFPVPSLGTAINDISAIGDQLTSSGYQAIELKDAKYDDIVDMFQYLAKKVKPGQDVIIYFAGHGYLREETGIGYWIPSDVDVTSSEKWISTKHISEYLSKISASHIMVISDSCYSGSLTREYTYSTDGDTLSPEEMSKRRAVMALSSGGEEPVMDGGGDGHSVFARHLLSSLAKGNRLRTGFDLFHEVRSEVVKEAPQTPQYGAMISAGHQVGGDYLFTGQ